MDAPAGLPNYLLRSKRFDEGFQVSEGNCSSKSWVVEVDESFAEDKCRTLVKHDSTDICLPGGDSCVR